MFHNQKRDCRNAAQRTPNSEKLRDLVFQARYSSYSIFKS